MTIDQVIDRAAMLCGWYVEPKNDYGNRAIRRQGDKMTECLITAVANVLRPNQYGLEHSLAATRLLDLADAHLLMDAADGQPGLLRSQILKALGLTEPLEVAQ